jgi:hypothetical protein
MTYFKSIGSEEFRFAWLEMGMNKEWERGSAPRHTIAPGFSPALPGTDDQPIPPYGIGQPFMISVF